MFVELELVLSNAFMSIEADGRPYDRSYHSLIEGSFWSGRYWELTIPGRSRGKYEAPPRGFATWITVSSISADTTRSSDDGVVLPSLSSR